MASSVIWAWELPYYRGSSLGDQGMATNCCGKRYSSLGNENSTEGHTLACTAVMLTPMPQESASSCYQKQWNSGSAQLLLPGLQACKHSAAAVMHLAQKLHVNCVCLSLGIVRLSLQCLLHEQVSVLACRLICNSLICWHHSVQTADCKQLSTTCLLSAQAETWSMLHLHWTAAESLHEDCTCQSS